MCGINGVYQRDSVKDSVAKVQEMNKVTHQRGPDHEAIYEDESVVLGHNRLAIIDLDDKANQPFISADENIILTYNGELYNYISLKNQLSSNYDFKTKSDTEVIVAAYKQWGIKMLEKFNGMFALALWDKSKNHFYLCRDRLGIKPLYYKELNKAILFSSSIKALKTFSCDDFSINDSSISSFLSYGTIHSPDTIINGIKQLPRASYYFASEEQSEIVEYWSFFDTSFSLRTYEDTISKTRELLISAVEKRLVSDVPYGVFLSGGIDSSILVAAASKLSAKTVNTFSVVFGEKLFDERNYSQIIASKYKTNHSELSIDPNDVLNRIEEPFIGMDHPTIDGINTYFIADAVSKQGFKMALSGTGADELFAGYPVFKQATQLASKKWLYSFPPQLRNWSGKLWKMYDPSPLVEKKADILNQRILELAYYYPIFRRVFSLDKIDELVNVNTKDFKSYPFKWGLHELEPKRRGASYPFLSKITTLEMETYLQNVLLRDADQMGMANSLEIRVPFLDHELVEFVLSIPDNYKYPKYPKKILVDATKGWLPDEIIHRKKMGFVFPWELWMKNELKDFCAKSISYLECNSVFNMNVINGIWNDFLKGKSNVSWLQIWTLVVMGKWMKNNNIDYV